MTMACVSSLWPLAFMILLVAYLIVLWEALR